jgi:hypothetical protein
LKTPRKFWRRHSTSMAKMIEAILCGLGAAAWGWYIWERLHERD